MKVPTEHGFRAPAPSVKIVACTLGLTVAGILGSASVAHAALIPMTNQYSIGFTPILQGNGSYQFNFQVKNLTQNLGTNTGLDGFFVEVPHTATVSSVVEPPSYTPPTNGTQYWSLSRVQNSSDPTMDWLEFWGNSPASVYQLNGTASFSFITSSFVPNTIPLELVSYWGVQVPNVSYTTSLGANYSTYTASVAAPIGSVPEPASLSLLGLGVAGLLAARRRRG